MRVAALYDIHGNLPALEAVLEAVEREDPDVVVVGGDVLPGPRGTECLRLLASLERPVRYLAGNGEREVLSLRRGGSPPPLPPDVVASLRWAGDDLPEELVRDLDGWPATQRVEFADLGSVLFCHATPTSDSILVTEATPEKTFRAHFAGAGADIVVCGHTHMQFDRTTDGTRVVNAGSVGMPFGKPGAHWLLLHSDVELRRTEYDLQAAAKVLRASGDPRGSHFAEENVLKTPEAEPMIELFEEVRERGAG